ncbi:Undecaprenyl-phosphate galactose phosphotransferase WbaP/exopolysaccharide biosynthesis polyprenyl glycosylphosphotransferase [Cellulosimicrobium cellulans J34]|nr:Undecaprenyl-phosphate galactose phosphotransferase WbaP/exopolysaccharide biosynthesis polyprenyl glycosylphosphotransferase [Cellulosimicrobium cellulans J34]SMF00541.1 Undecaprenyl-phosphate galactose phosphotransferase, WbaP/exopolysaccharide biosynthesis polyprenyl glycosylphosphotransferase [Cellulosimicrobium cellulans J1]
MTLEKDHEVDAVDLDGSGRRLDAPSFDTGQLVRISLGAYRRPGWKARLARRVAVVDALAVATAVATAYLVRFDGIGGTTLDLQYAAISAALLVVWWCALRAAFSRDGRSLGSGAPEYARVVNATVAVFGVVAIAAYLLRYDLARGYVAIALPVGLVLLVLGRWAVRRQLVRMRRRGRCRSRTVVVGGRDGVAHLVGSLREARDSGYEVVGACVPGGPLEPHETVAGVPVVGEVGDTARLVEPLHADTVMVTGSDLVTPRTVKRLAWDLEPWGADLVLAPALTDVAGPRIRTRPVAGLPLLHVEAPGYSGPQHVLKRAFDVVGALGLLVLFAVPLVVTALAVKLTSRGPVLFTQERVGLRGEPFTVLKFRSMVVDAESRLEDVLGAGNVGVFYKPKQDPRVTRVGAFLRRYSIDELPQLFNVLGGSMSLVGPRPQVALEVDQYDDEIGRRLLVKPGLTGLWQVSGRNNLTLEESVRLDLYYVENWTVTGDLLILLRTLRAVVGRDGAY